MVNRALLSALAVCFAVAGCDSQKPAEPPKTKSAAAVVPLPPEAPKAPAASAGQDAQPAQMAKAGAWPTKGCKAGQCKVDLDVTGDGDPNCRIGKSRDPLPVWTQNKGDTMRWIINTADWEFDNDGIKFTNAQFTVPGHDGAKHKYKVVNANSDTTPAEYPYTISLTNKKTGKKCTKDPSIVNGVVQPD